ncbi:MAG: hypothetical protein AAF999_18585 [Pseudomonadota bacterium]
MPDGINLIPEGGIGKGTIREDSLPPTKTFFVLMQSKTVLVDLIISDLAQTAFADRNFNSPFVYRSVVS